MRIRVGREPQLSQRAVYVNGNAVALSSIGYYGELSRYNLGVEHVLVP